MELFEVALAPSLDRVRGIGFQYVVSGHDSLKVIIECQR
ncbi:MAG: hypothetical protein XD78_0768 [Desulfotomaculum sp. 46_296]|nr:MAG: hypothetical protein XD78_0768 [Desulfotomaculum sp. 46_296]